jgi:hypothetical protein
MKYMTAKELVKGIIKFSTLGISASLAFSACNKAEVKQTNPLHYVVIENETYDIPAKSQVSFRAYLTDSSYTKEQLQQLTDSIATECKSTYVKWHDKPTHVFVYIYKAENDYKENGASWISMYELNRGEDFGTTIKNIEQ